MKDREFLFTLLVVAGVTLGIVVGLGILMTFSHAIPTTSTVALRKIQQTISASGSIHSQNEVTLHFQVGGKVVYLPFKQGDAVGVGQTIASLDTYALERSLQIQANAYQIAKNTNDQTQENQKATILEGQARTTLDSTNKNAYNNITEAQVITDTVQRLVDNSILAQNTAQLQVDLANYAFQLASLTAPFSGILTQEDITTANVNITPTTAFSLADPKAKVFRASVAASDIDFVSVGAKATIHLDGVAKPIQGVVIKVYPQKQTLTSGDVYFVDVLADSLNSLSVFGQNGSVLIENNVQTPVAMVPSWTIVGHNSLWVWDGKKIVLRTVVVGKTHANMTEILNGLSNTDRIIVLPKTIVEKKYQLL